MKISVITFLFLALLFFASCGSFGQGFLTGLGNMGGYGGGYGGYVAPSGGSMDYLLDPNYAISQVAAQEEREYQTFSQFNKKPDGSSYSKNEWRSMKGEAIRSMNSGSSSSSYGGSSSSGVSTLSSSSHLCRKTNVSDMAHCNGTGVCQRCNGNKRYYDTSLGSGRWVDPCSVCGGTGKCPSCNGRGSR